MLRVRFTAEDLLRVRVATHPAPLMELSLALMTLKRRDADAVFGRWRHRLRQTLPAQARPMLQLVSPTGVGPLFLDPVSTGLADGLNKVRSTSPAFALAEFQRVCGAGVARTEWIRRLASHDQQAWQSLEESITAAYHHVLADAWPRILSGFHAEVALRTRSMAQHGLLATLTSLSPGIRWNGMTLEIPHAQDREIALGGVGLVLLPSLLWTAPPLVAVQRDGPALLVYPAVTPLPLQDSPTTADPLTALLGTTRALMLRLLTREHTTTGLARALDITAPAASMQTRTLREARLITTHREGKTVWHWCTPLGLDILTATQPPLT
ncbi:helix-turn-helix domain-containing protein [Streptomyces sp. NPDC052101]|uniref:ArsR/SmtB family transcription factor n=1 Tax=Streptomyces sp. NPDC052101 TaxID=3155763 RepID=UPI0034161C90